MFTAEMIAPCGLDCNLCPASHREQNPCPGCNGPDEYKSEFCESLCPIKKCSIRIENGYKLCSECSQFPCSYVLERDAVYRSRLVSYKPIENLRKIAADGMDAFLKEEELEWTCAECGEPYISYLGTCMGCGKKHPRLK